MLAKFLNRNPALMGLAHYVYTTGLSAKNATLHPIIKNTGWLPGSLSDRGQDRWVISIFDGKREGYFLDLGGADGFCESNTYVLEKRYGWKGICIEPNPELFQAMTGKYDRRCTCLNQAIDDAEGVVEFRFAGQEGGIIADDTDNSAVYRADLIKRDKAAGAVSTIRAKPLAQVLVECDAPEAIDYFSLDVEGAEYRILRNFPFDKYRFLAMTIERPSVELNRLLFGKGYHFIRNSLYDTFYVHESIPNFGQIPKMPFEQVPPKAF